MRRRCIALAAVLLAVAGPACRFDGLAFRVDERIEITSPDDRDEVQLPFDVTWSVEDFEIVGSDQSDTDDAGYFAVLLDTSPMPPGENLTYFARDDDTCPNPSQCVDEQYLADRDIFLTTDTTFTIDAIEDLRPVDRPSADDLHEITIILLNGRSARIGESAFRVSVIVDRGQI